LQFKAATDKWFYNVNFRFNTSIEPMEKLHVIELYNGECVQKGIPGH